MGLVLKLKNKYWAISTCLLAIFFRGWKYEELRKAMVFLNNLSWEDRKSQSKQPCKKRKREIAGKGRRSIAGYGSLGPEEPFGESSDLMGRRTQQWMKVPFKRLFSSCNRKGLLRVQVSEPWCNRRQAATAETKHKPRFLPEYSTQGMGGHWTHF